MTIIGLAGYARSGKDSVGQVLVKRRGFERRAFADKIREALIALDPMVSSEEKLPSDRLSRLLGEGLYGSVEELKRSGIYGRDFRRLMQRMGTEVGRELFGETFWIDQCLPVVDLGSHGSKYLKVKGTKYSDDIVVTDVRFPNEAQRIRDLGGQIWWIDRPGVEPVNGHPSDNSLDVHDADRVLSNHRTLDDLTEAVEAVLA